MNSAVANKQKVGSFIGLLLSTFASYFMIAGSSVFVAGAVADLGGREILGLIFTVENLFRCCTLPLAGKLGDKIGRKKLFLISSAGYIVAAILCTFASSIFLFMAGRAFMGMTWGLFFANIFVMVTDIYDEDTSPKMIGYMQSVGMVAMLISGPLCGFLIDNLNWRAVFYLLVPIVMLAWIFIAFFLPNIQKKQAGVKLDGMGVLFTAITFGSLSLALSTGDSIFAWNSLPIYLLGAIFFLGLYGLISTERKAIDPIFPSVILKNKNYMKIFGMGACFAIASAMGNYLPTYAICILHTNATMSGLLVMPSLIVGLMGASIVGGYIAKTNKYKGIAVVFGLFTIIGGILTGMFTEQTPFWFILITMSIFGVGQSIQQVAPYTYSNSVLDKKLISSGVAFISFGQILSTAIANAIYSFVMNNGFMNIFKIPVIFGALMIVFAIIFKDRKGINTPTEPKT